MQIYHMSKESGLSCHHVSNKNEEWRRWKKPRHAGMLSNEG